MTRTDTLSKILLRGFVPVVVADRLPVMDCLGQLLEAGVEAVEISCRHPEALELLGEAKRRFPSLAVGAATLVEDGRLRDFVNAQGQPVPSIAEVVEAGADFLVSLMPFREATFERFRDQVVIISGVATPGEAAQALDWGANLLKYVNPHLLGGPEFFKALDPATYRSFPFFVTGGIKPNLAAGYIEAGILAVGAGLEMALGADYIALQAAFDAEIMRERVQDYVATLDRARQRHQPDIPFASRDLVAIQRASGRCLNL